jgi:hypothetical protein
VLKMANSHYHTDHQDSIHGCRNECGSRDSIPAHQRRDCLFEAFHNAWIKLTRPAHLISWPIYRQSSDIDALFSTSSSSLTHSEEGLKCTSLGPTSDILWSNSFDSSHVYSAVVYHGKLRLEPINLSEPYAGLVLKSQQACTCITDLFDKESHSMGSLFNTPLRISLMHPCLLEMQTQLLVTNSISVFC